jgi:hypothetical protein
MSPKLSFNLEVKKCPLSVTLPLFVVKGSKSSTYWNWFYVYWIKEEDFVFSLFFISLFFSSKFYSSFSSISKPFNLTLNLV